MNVTGLDDQLCATASCARSAARAAATTNWTLLLDIWPFLAAQASTCARCDRLDQATSIGNGVPKLDHTSLVLSTWAAESVAPFLGKRLRSIPLAVVRPQ